MEPIRIAFLGAGKRASYLYHRLVSQIDDVELVGVWSRSDSSARALGEKLGVPWFTDMAKLKDETGAQAFSRYGPSYLRYLVLGVARRPRLIVRVVTLAVVGHHYFTMTRATVRRSRELSKARAAQRAGRRRRAARVDPVASTPMALSE